MMKKMMIYLSDLSTNQILPLYEIGLFAGFPSPAQDYAASGIDLNVALLIDPENTRIIQIQDNDLEGVNIYERDIAIIATDMAASKGDKIFCCVDGEYLNRIVELDENDNSILLTSTNPRIKPVKITEDSNCIVNGVITYTITPHIPYKFYSNGKKDGTIDLNKLLIPTSENTFFGIINGNSMIEAGILHGDLAIIDKSLPYINGYKALCRIENKFTIKYLEWDKDKSTLWLIPANKNFPPIKVRKDESVTVWGIITHTITPHNRKFNIL